MRHARIVRPRGVLSACLGLACVVLQAGCTHNYYYGYTPCTPGGTVVVPGAVSSGSVCELPAGSTVVSGATTDSAVTTKAAPPKVVVSEPGRGSASRFWRAADPDGSMVTTKVEGAVDSPTITR